MQTGSGVPDSVDLYVAPGASASSVFNSASNLATKITNPASGATLSVSVGGAGSFSYNKSYKVTAQASSTASEGDYTGGIAVSASTLAADNKSVPVIVHVTSQPIATASPQVVRFRIAQGAAKATQYIVLSNSGLGSLAASSISFGSGGAPSWLSTSITGNIVVLTADPAGLGPSVQTANASISSNARNGPVTVPIELDVLASSPPITYFQAVLDNATFSGASLSPGEIVALFGEQLTAGPGAVAGSLPLGTSLGGATVTVNGKAAPVYYVAAGQIDFIVPYGTAAGTALVSVSRDGQTGNTVTASVVPVSPEILPLGIGNYGNIVLSDFVTRPMPPTPGIASRPAKAGVDVITIYALGLGQTTPAAADGVAAPGAEPLARVNNVGVTFGDPLSGAQTSAAAAFAGLTPGLVGLYQINVTVPVTSPRGSAVPLKVSLGAVSSNTVAIAIGD
jgi:uncharacterized protein (TIGR03437 family)